MSLYGQIRICTFFALFVRKTAHVLLLWVVQHHLVRQEVSCSKNFTLYLYSHGVACRQTSLSGLTNTECRHLTQPCESRLHVLTLRTLPV